MSGKNIGNENRTFFRFNGNENFHLAEAINSLTKITLQFDE